MQLIASQRPKRAATDKIDFRILSVLQRDGRISNLKLAEEVHLSPSAVLGRVKRLQQDGYILGYQARLNPEKLGMGMAAFVEVVFDRTASDVMEGFRAAVQATPAILECHLIAGGFDCLLKVLVSDMGSCEEQVAQAVGALPGVRSTRTYTVMEQVDRSRSAGAEPAIDAIDAQLLRLLQADGRITLARLADAVGLSAASVHERVSHLRRKGFILGYEAVLNQAKLNSDLLVFAEVALVEPSASTGRALKAAVQARDEIIECHEVAGGFDYLIKTRVRDMQHYRELAESVVWRLPGVRDVRTYAVIDEMKNTARIPL